MGFGRRDQLPGSIIVNHSIFVGISFFTFLFNRTHAKPTLVRTMETAFQTLQAILTTVFLSRDLLEHTVKKVLLSHLVVELFAVLDPIPRKSKYLYRITGNVPFFLLNFSFLYRTLKQPAAVVCYK